MSREPVEGLRKALHHGQQAVALVGPARTALFPERVLLARRGFALDLGVGSEPHHPALQPRDDASVAAQGLPLRDAGRFFLPQDRGVTNPRKAEELHDGATLQATAGEEEHQGARGAAEP